MSSDLDADMARSMSEANISWQNFQAAHSIFVANCQRHDFVSAEAEREKMHVALDAYLDANLAAYRRLEVARAGK